MLQEVKRQMQKHGGDLTGTVWDVTRSGKLVETIGDRMEYIESVPREDWEKYFLDLGSAERGGDRPLELDVYPWLEVFKNHSYDQLRNLVGGKGKKSTEGSGSRSEGANY